MGEGFASGRPFPRVGDPWPLREPFFRGSSDPVRRPLPALRDPEVCPPRVTRVGFEDRLFPGLRDRVPTFGACVVTKDGVHELGNLPHCFLETVR